jgi:PAS domain S-box-containing protein
MADIRSGDARAPLLAVEQADGAERFKAIFEQAPLGIIVLGPGGFIEQANERFCELVGRPRHEVVARSWECFTHGDDRAEQRLQLARLLDGESEGFSLEKRYVRPHGAVFWARLNVGRIGYQRCLVLVEDITAQRESELAVRASEEQLRQRVQSQLLYEQALEEAARQKDHFLAILGHELRNPLAAITTAAALLNRIEEAQAPGLARVRGIVERQTKHMTKLVDGLLDVSRIARGKFHLERRPTDIVALIQNALEDRRELIETHRLQLVAELPGEPLFASIDATRVAQILDNLLTNAIKFTEAPGTITVRLYLDGGVLVLRVRDTGIGIEPSLLTKLFEPFQQLDHDQSEGGLGLGLALVRGLAELHGGEVCARSDGPHMGAEVEVRLPRGSLSQPEARKGAAVEESKRVLVIGDDRDFADGLRALLEIAGHRPRVVYDVPSALALAPDFRPEVVLCDVTVQGGVAGYDFARTVATHATLRDARLIALTGQGRGGDRERALAAGFDEQLSRPVDVERLETCIFAAG